MTPAPTLRPYQRDALDAVVNAMGEGLNRLLIKKPTGTGKTVMFAAMLEWPPLKDWLASFDKPKMLVIAQREELLDQAADKIIRQNPHARVSIEQGDRRAHGAADVVIASIQTLAAAKYKRLHRLMQRHEFKLVIVDEAHHAAARTYRGVLAILGFLPLSGAQDSEDPTDIEAATFDDVKVMEANLANWDAIAPKDRLLVGVTATPNRSDAIGLGCVFQAIAYSYNLKDAIVDKWLVPIVPWVVETQSTLDDVRTNRGEFNQKDLAEVVNNERRNQLAVAAWHEHAEGLSTLAFTVDVAHAHALAEEFRRSGVKAEALSGETPTDVRRSMLQAYTDGRVELITNCMVLTEGTDLPRTGCILHAKPTKSATLYEQMTGRGLRIHPGKEQCVVIDIVDIAKRHSLQTASVLYGLPPGLKAQGKDLREVEQVFEELREKYPQIGVEGRMTLEELRARASTFDVWTIQDIGPIGEGLTMNWIRVGDDSYRLSFPSEVNGEKATEVLLVEPDLVGRYTVTLAARAARILPTPGQPYVVDMPTPKVIGAGILNAKDALHMADSYVVTYRPSVQRLKDRNAPWRTRPASPKQIALLGKFRAPIRPGLTMGEASDMLDQRMARNR